MVVTSFFSQFSLESFLSSAFLISLFVIIFLSLIALLLYVYLAKRRGQRGDAAHFPPPRISLTFNQEDFPLISINKRKVTPSAEWLQMAKGIVNDLSQSHRINLLFLIHGTFVGSDPFSTFRILENYFPTVFTPKTLQKIRTLSLKKKDHIIFDSANFCEEYAALLQNIAGDAIAVSNFYWSSGNHHVARLMGVCDLILRLYERSRLLPKLTFRPLILGHSHGGQILALLSQFMASSELSRTLKQFIKEHHLVGDFDQFEDAIAHLRGHKFALVTFGTPVRYPFIENDRIRVLHIINHRTASFAPLSLSGILFTRDGDYPHKWGVAGSDFLAPTQQERSLNNALNSILGPGLDLKLLKDNLTQIRFGHKVGTHMWVNYRDNGNPPKPNFASSFFGHGVYTRFITLLFQLTTINNWLNKK